MDGQTDLPQHMASDAALFRARLKKLILYRLILAVFFLLLVIGVTLSKNEDVLSSRLHPLYFFSCILFLFTIFCACFVKRGGRLRGFAWLQVLFDISAVTVLVYLSGGVESHFSLLYPLVIISSALLFQRHGSLLTASACSLVYGLLLDLQYFGMVSPLQIIGDTGYHRDSGIYFINILANIAGFFLVALLSGYLAREVHESSRQAREHKRDLSRLSTLHKSIVQSMTSGLLTVDSEGRIAFLNAAGEEILGFNAKVVEGCELDKVLPEIDMSIFTAPNQPQDARMEINHTLPSGNRICIGYSVSVLQGQTGDPFGSIITFRDLTQVKAIEDHMQRVERLAFAGRIAAEIAHEIKNPLAAMSGAVQMLQGETGQEAFHSRLLGIVEREIGRINVLVTDFLWLAKGPPQSGKIEDVPICAAIQDIMSLLKSKNQVCESHGLQTDFKAAPTVRIDPHHLRQVFWNLFMNAIEAMPDGGELLVAVECGNGKSGQAETRVDISDTGCGIPENASQRIFDPFFTTKVSGTGLGLSIVYQLVEKAGGRIEANSNPSGRGMTFSVFFPS